MKRSLPCLAAFLVGAVLCCSSLAGQNKAASGAPAHIQSVTALTKVFGGGQKVVAAIVEYDQNISNASLSNSLFSVKGRTITKVYANAMPASAAKGVDGKYVIVELDPDEAAAAIIIQDEPGQHSVDGPGGQGGPGGSGGASGPGSFSAMKTSPAFSAPPRVPAKVAVQQIGEIGTVKGEKLAPFAPALVSTKTIDPIADLFVQRVFKDAKTGKSLPYNLYVPKDYDKAKSYPLVLFMPDASTTGGEVERSLIQGLGAIIWATPEVQAKHEAIVVAPTYAEPITNDAFQATDALDTTVDLVDALSREYSVDRNRLYTTGQSGGCMMSVAIMIKYPDEFAAAMLVAGQWDPKGMTTLIHKKMWIIVSEGDGKAFPGMNTSLAAMEAAGAKVTRARWDAQRSPEETNANDQKMIEQGNHILYTVYEKGTTLPANLRSSGEMEHRTTWRFAYLNEGVRDWLFQQTK